MAIFLEDLNTTQATTNAYAQLMALYMKSEEWKHIVDTAESVATRVVTLITEGKVCTGERISPAELERLVNLPEVDLPAHYRTVAGHLYNDCTLDTVLTAEDLKDIIVDYWKGVTEEQYYLTEYASDICAEFDSVGNIIASEAGE